MERRTTASPAVLSSYPSSQTHPSQYGFHSWIRMTRNRMGTLNWTEAFAVTL
jgi:hypothetical protein